MDFGVFTRHDRSNHWCRFPRMKCVCGNSYERLDDSRENENNTKNQVSDEDLVFHNEDGSFHCVVVESKLCAEALCLLLAHKNRVTTSDTSTLSIVETWVNFGAERYLEDHEYVLGAYRCMESYSQQPVVKYYFRKDPTSKYRILEYPEEFFQSSMLSLTKEESSVANKQGLNVVVQSNEWNPTVFSHVYIRDEKTKRFKRIYMCLKFNVIYAFKELTDCSAFVRGTKDMTLQTSLEEFKQFEKSAETFAELADCRIYRTLNAKNQLEAPVEWGVVLRPAAVDAGNAKEAGGAEGAEAKGEVRCFACDSDRVRTCWIEAMRLAKYGKQIRESYKLFKSKKPEASHKRQPIEAHIIPSESSRSRVAMDFTGPVSRVIEDPREAEMVAMAEGYSWKKRLRPTCRTAAKGGFGIHTTQPWYHSDISREVATAIITRADEDGVFLVRDSQSTSGVFVLSYKYGNKVYHSQIVPVRDVARDEMVFSLDNGSTKFFDIVQLIEFYQLNTGSLYTRLTTYYAGPTHHASPKLTT